MSGKILIIDPNAHRRALCQAIQNSLHSRISAKDIETADYSGVEVFCCQPTPRHAEHDPCATA